MKFLKLLEDPSLKNLPSLFPELLFKLLKSPMAIQGPAKDSTIFSTKLQKLALSLMLGGPYIARSIQVTEGGSFQVLHLLSKIRLILLICPQIQCNNNAHENPNLIFILLALAFDSAIKNNIRTFLPRQSLQSFNCQCSTSTRKFQVRNLILIMRW